MMTSVEDLAMVMLTIIVTTDDNEAITETRRQPQTDMMRET
jgi:hypothetical protein